MKVFKTIYYVFLGAIALIALLLILSTFNFSGNIKFLVVQSGSMEPSIKVGSVVVVKSVSNYKVGDIITFGPYSKTKTPTTHRIYEIKGDCPNCTFVTKGDANNGPDQHDIRLSDIIGKVLLDVPYVGYAVATAKKPVGFALIIIIPAAIIIYDEVRKIWAEVKKMRRKKHENEILKTEKEN